MATRSQSLACPASRLSPVPRILVVGEYWSLLKSAADVLKKTDTEVRYCFPSQLAGQWTNHFDLLVLCHTVSSAEAASIASDARWRWPDIRILQLLRFDFGSPVVPPFADAAAISGSPQAFVATAMKLLDSDYKKRLAA
jgi:hypothetical protein